MFNVSCSSKAEETRLFCFLLYKQTIVLKYLIVEISFLSLHVLENIKEFACGRTNRK